MGKALKATDAGSVDFGRPQSVRSPSMTGEWELRLKKMEGSGQLPGIRMKGIEEYVIGVLGQVQRGPDLRLASRATAAGAAGGSAATPGGRTGMVTERKMKRAWTGGHVWGGAGSVPAAGGPAGQASSKRPRRALPVGIAGVAAPICWISCETGSSSRTSGHIGGRLPVGAVWATTHFWSCRPEAASRFVTSFRNRPRRHDACHKPACPDEDQVTHLDDMGFNARCLHSGLSREDSRNVCKEYLAGVLDFFMIARAAVRPGLPGDAGKTAAGRLSPLTRPTASVRGDTTSGRTTGC